MDRIALSQFEELTGIDRRKCHAILKKLIKKKVIKKSVTQKGDRTIITYGFQKNFDIWKVSPKKVTITQKDDRVSPKKAHTKETIQKKVYPSTVVDFCDTFILYIKKSKGNLSPKGENINENSYDTIDKLIRLDGFDIEYIKKVLRWGVKDSFWSKNVISLASLRKKDGGLTKFQKVANAHGDNNKADSSNQFLSGGF